MKTDFTPEPASLPGGDPADTEALAQRLAAKGDHFRQGDVLGVRSALPASAQPLPRDNGAVVLAYGKVTGHSHQLRGPNVTMFRDTSGHEFIRVDGPEALVHEEHSTIALPAGDYELLQQVEFAPAELRSVAD